MGLDWTALEQGLHRVALQKVTAIMAEHPGHSFYGLALHGVPTEEDGELVLPVLALNSEQALARDLAEEDDDLDEADDEDEDWQETEGGDYVPPPLDGSDPDEDDEDEDDEADEEPDEDDESGLSDADEDSEGYYSRRWDPTDWHWSAVALVDDAAASVWEKAFAAEVDSVGWAETTRRYYELMVRVINELRGEILAGKGVELVCFVADDDHAERLLRASLTTRQLRAHFPDLVPAEG